MLEENKKHDADNGPKDDVTGASVTANNASARLSSLEHCPITHWNKKSNDPPHYESTGEQSSSDDSLLTGVEEKKKSEDASDDSGYRESNDSREESSSSWSDTSRSNGKSVEFFFLPLKFSTTYTNTCVRCQKYCRIVIFRSSNEASCSYLSNVSNSR